MKKIYKLFICFIFVLICTLLSSCYIINDKQRYTITEEEWNALNIENNFTYIRYEYTETGIYEYVSKYTKDAIEIDGSIIIFIDDLQYYLSEDESGWVARDVTIMDYWHGGVLENMNFDDYHYDESRRSYVTEINEFNGSYREIKFIDGLPTKYTEYIPISDSLPPVYDKYEVFIKNVGTTKIEIPEYTFYEPVEFITTVTEEEWNQIANEYNYSLFFFNDFDNDGYPLCEQDSIKGAYLLNGEYYIEKDDKIYVLSETESGFIAVETDEFLGYRGPLLQGLKFTDVIYNLENQCYEYYEENGLKYSFYFGNGLLELICIEDLLSSVISQEYFFISDYGYLKVDVPEYTLNQ